MCIEDEDEAKKRMTGPARNMTSEHECRVATFSIADFLKLSTSTVYECVNRAYSIEEAKAGCTALHVLIDLEACSIRVHST